MQEVFKIILEGFKLPVSYLILPEKRIYVLYLFTSLLLAYYVFARSKAGVSFFRYVFAKKVWASKSSFVDYQLFFINGFVKLVALAPVVILGVVLQEFASDLLYSFFGTPSIKVSRFWLVFIYTVTIWLVSDFASFFTHYLLHKIPLLWRFHKIHHSATVLNPITQYRIHPVELVINNFKTIIVFGFVTGVFYYLADGKIGIIPFLGVNAFKFLFLILGSNLRHSHVKLKFPSWLEFLIISPYQHQIHHSDKEEHYDKNIGSHLAIWDWFFGTLILSKHAKKIKFGLGKKENKNYQSVMKNLFNPFKTSN